MPFLILDLTEKQLNLDLTQQLNLTWNSPAKPHLDPIKLVEP